MKKKILSAIGIGVILQWLSLFFSYKVLQDVVENTNAPIATGGFPFKTFEYPVPPMGGNWPPADTWPTFFLNLAIWLIVGFILSLALGKVIEKTRFVRTASILAIILTIVGMFYITLKFD